MSLIDCKCPACGASIKVNDKAKGSLTCQFCGSEFSANQVTSNASRRETSNSDFVIEKGVLIDYLGSDDVVAIPDKVRAIKSLNLTKYTKKVILPAMLEEIGDANAEIEVDCSKTKGFSAYGGILYQGQKMIGLIKGSPNDFELTSAETFGIKGWGRQGFILIDIADQIEDLTELFKRQPPSLYNKDSHVFYFMNNLEKHYVIVNGVRCSILKNYGYECAGIIEVLGYKGKTHAERAQERLNLAKLHLAKQDPAYLRRLKIDGGLKKAKEIPELVKSIDEKELIIYRLKEQLQAEKRLTKSIGPYILFVTLSFLFGIGVGVGGIPVFKYVDRLAGSLMLWVGVAIVVFGVFLTFRLIGAKGEREYHIAQARKIQQDISATQREIDEANRKIKSYTQEMANAENEAEHLKNR